MPNPRTGIGDKDKSVQKTPGLAGHVSGVDNRALRSVAFYNISGSQEDRNRRDATRSRNDGSIYYGLLDCTHVLHGIVAGKRRRGRPRRRWTDDIKQWTGIPIAECVQQSTRKRQKRVESLGVHVSDLRSSVIRMDIGKARSCYAGINCRCT